jgi:hypothetical protein
MGIQRVTTASIALLEKQARFAEGQPRTHTPRTLAREALLIKKLISRSANDF